MSVAIGIFSRSLNPHFFDWPTLFMYVVSIAYALYFRVGLATGWFPTEAAFLAEASQQPAPLFRIARGVSAAAGLFTVATVHAIGRHLFDRTTGLVSAFFLACAALHARDSHFGVTDVAATWLVTLSFLFTATFARDERPRDAIVAGMFAGLAGSTKYNASLILLPAIWAIVHARRPSRVWLLAGCLAAAIAAFVAGTPYALVDRAAFVAALESISSHLRGGHAAMAGPGWIVHLSSSLRFGLGLPMLIAGIGGMVLYVIRDWRAGVLFCLFPLTYYALIGGGQTAFARYILPVVPFLCLSAGYLIVETARLLARGSALEPALAGVLALAVAAPSAWSAIRSDLLLSQRDTRLLAAEWIHDHYPDGTTIAQTGTVAAKVQMRTAADPATAARYRDVELNRGTGSFRAGDVPPEVVVVEECALPYCSVSDRLRADLTEAYQRQSSFIGVDPTANGVVYDRDDEFYVPLAGFEAVTRPGPNISIYSRSRQP